MAATSILDLFDGSISDFLQEGTTLFNGDRNLLDHQFQRLSPLESEVMQYGSDKKFVYEGKQGIREQGEREIAIHVN